MHRLYDGTLHYASLWQQGYGVHEYVHFGKWCCRHRQKYWTKCHYNKRWNNASGVEYSKVVVIHYLHRDAVDNHTIRRHSPICLVTTWATKTWQNRVSAFILAGTKVNIVFVDKMINKDEDRKVHESFLTSGWTSHRR
jgi:hypothetical protein